MYDFSGLDASNQALCQSLINFKILIDRGFIFIQPALIMTQTNLELKSKLFSQIEILGKEKSLLPFSNTSIDETIKVKNIWQSIYNPHPSAPQMKCV